MAVGRTSAQPSFNPRTYKNASILSIRIHAALAGDYNCYYFEGLFDICVSIHATRAGGYSDFIFYYADVSIHAAIAGDHWTSAINASG